MMVESVTPALLPLLSLLISFFSFLHYALCIMNYLSYGRRKEEGDCGSDTLHHHGAWRTTRNICAAIMWLALALWDI